MTAITLVLLTIGVLFFAFGTFAVVSLLRLVDKLFQEKRIGPKD